MSLRLSVAAVRAYDLMKQRPGAPRRRSDARDGETLDQITRRLEELVATYRVNGHDERGATYVFWTEVSREVEAGAFDDLLARL